MKNYNVTGKERKALVNKIAELTGERPVYLGMPTVAFKVGPFEVSRTGTLTWEEGAEETAEQLVRDLRIAGFVAEGDEETTDTPAAESDSEPEPSEEITLEEPEHMVGLMPTDGAETAQDAPERPQTAGTNTCEVEEEKLTRTASTALAVIPEEGFFKMADTIENHAEDTPEMPEAVREQSAAESTATDLLTISLPDTLTDQQFTLLQRLVAGKETLLKHAFKADSALIERSEGKLSFPWFTASDGDHTMAYSQFLTSLIRFAKKAKRVTARDQESDNEKFSFRIFLIRIGMVGDEYKAARKILLENLSGNSAWRFGKPAETTTETEASE